MGTQGISIGGMAEQDIASFIGSYYIAKELKAANEQARGDVNTAYTEAEEYQKPYSEQGNKFYKDLGKKIESGAFQSNQPQFKYDKYKAPQQPDISSTFNYKDFNYEQDPGYNFRLQQGKGAIESSAAARGSQLSGATLKALSKYGQDFASNEYNNAYNRYNTDRNFARNSFTTDRDFTYNNYLNNRNFSRDVYNQDKAFTYGVARDLYNNDVQQKNNKYNQYANMAQTGINAGNNISNLRKEKGMSLADLSIQRGNIQAGKMAGYMNAAIQQGGHLEEIGGMGKGNSDQGGGSSQGGGGGGDWLSSFMGGMGGSSGGGGMDSGMAMEGGYA